MTRSGVLLARPGGRRRSSRGRWGQAAACGFAVVSVAAPALAGPGGPESPARARLPSELTASDRPGGPKSPALAPFSRPPAQDFENLPYDGAYTFVRLRFNVGERGGLGRGFGRGPPWAHDFPYADHNFAKLLDEVTLVGPHTDGTNVVSADSPDLHRFPIAYVAEPGYWRPTRAEVANMSAYLAKGGFLILDDFRGPREWANVEAVFAAIQLRRGHYFVA